MTYNDVSKVVLVAAHPKETAEKVEKFLESKDLKVQALLDPLPQQSLDAVGVKAPTMCVIIDAQGVLRYRGPVKLPKTAQLPVEDALKAVVKNQPVASAEITTCAG